MHGAIWALTALGVTGVHLEPAPSCETRVLLRGECGRLGNHPAHCCSGRSAGAGAGDLITTALSDVSERVPTFRRRARSSSGGGVCSAGTRTLALALKAAVLDTSPHDVRGVHDPRRGGACARTMGGCQSSRPRRSDEPLPARWCV